MAWAFGAGDHWQIYDDAGRRKYLSADEHRRFLEALDHLSPRKRALCMVLAYTGCRVSEALALTQDHLNRGDCCLTFRTLKRRRIVFRTVPIPGFLVAILEALPPLSDGRFWLIHRSTAWRIIKLVMRAAEISGPMACCKGLRHGFGVRAASSDVVLNIIQRWMGHASPATTAIYLDVVGAEERSFAERMW